MKRLKAAFITCVTFALVGLMLGYAVKLIQLNPVEKTLTSIRTVFSSLEKGKKIYIRVSVVGANVRKGPGTSYPKVQTFKQGTTFQTVGEQMVAGDLWYKIKDAETNNGWISSETVTKVSSPSVLLDAPILNQLPELQRGCEITSLAMLIDQSGKKANKMTLAKQIKTLPFAVGNYRSNPNDGFVGNIYTISQPGYGVYHAPVAVLAQKYLGNQVVDLTGSDWTTVENYLRAGHAVWVIINSTFKPLPSDAPNWYTWHTKEGLLRVTYKEHSVLVTGFSKNQVYVNDPLSGIKDRALAKDDFVEAWKQLGSQAISYKLSNNPIINSLN